MLAHTICLGANHLQGIQDTREDSLVKNLMPMAVVVFNLDIRACV